MLPRMPKDDGIRKSQTIAFGGYNHTLGAKNGQIWDEHNMCSDHYPVMSPRLPRLIDNRPIIRNPNGLHCNDGFFYIDGSDFYANGDYKGKLRDEYEYTFRTMESLGRYIVILPDKMYYDTIDEVLGNIELTVTVNASFEDGTYAEEEAEANTIKAPSGYTWGFKAGDAVEISGSSVEANNVTIIVREVSGNELRFYPNSFTNAPANSLTLSRNMPDMDFLCQNENRLWGCKDDTIYSSKLGDIFNWNVFDGISTDSYAVSVGSAGEFTGCCSFLGYPVFMKEEHIYKVYGDKPSNFQVMASASLGTAKGCHNSFAIAGETLFYMSRVGIVAYNGGVPSPISEAFGQIHYIDAVGGSDGLRYYVSMRDDTTNVWTLFVYDTRNGIWHKEDYTRILKFGWNDRLYMLSSDGRLLFPGTSRRYAASTEQNVVSMVEFADFTEDTQYAANHGANHKGTSKLQLRLELDEGTDLRISMSFDEGEWIVVSDLHATTKKSFYLPIIPRRSDHFRIRLEGVGMWKLWSLVRESYTGSELF